MLQYVQMLKSKPGYFRYCIQETDKDIIKYMNFVYQLCFGTLWDGKWLNRPKLMLLFDDMSGSSLFMGIQNNYFYKTIIAYRHLGIVLCTIALHGITQCFGYLRNIFSALLLFIGLN